MSISLDDSQRRLVPRWKASVNTNGDQETIPLVEQEPQSVATREDDEFFHAKVRDWHERQAVVYAADLVGASVVLNRQDEARDAAQFLLDNQRQTSPIVIDLARNVLGLPGSETISAIAPGANEVGPKPEWMEIHRIRLRLKDDARNPLAWSDLSRLYATIGLKERALRSMEFAVYFAPSSRFVLRSNARLLVHLNDSERAHDLLRRSPLVEIDPWITAAEIAVSAVAERTSRFIRKARSMLSKFEPSQITELAGALGSTAVADGNRREAKRFFQLALMKPTENTVAQVGWLGRQKILEFNPEYLNLAPRAFEASAVQCYTLGNWAESQRECRRWLEDEPFSTRPAILGSYVAIIGLEDFTQCVRIAERGLAANHEDTTLLNNLAVGLALRGDVERARSELAKIQSVNLNQLGKTVITATAGLIEYRSGFPAAGRQLYEEAVALARATADKERAAMATIMRAREEIRLRSPMAQVFMNEALDLSQNLESPNVKSLLERARREFEENYRQQLESGR